MLSTSSRDAVIARNPLKGFVAPRGCGNGPRINCLTSLNHSNPALNARHRPATAPPPFTQRGPNSGNLPTAKAANRSQSDPKSNFCALDNKLCYNHLAK